MDNRGEIPLPEGEGKMETRKVSKGQEYYVPVTVKKIILDLADTSKKFEIVPMDSVRDKLTEWGVGNLREDVKHLVIDPFLFEQSHGLRGRKAIHEDEEVKLGRAYDYSGMFVYNERVSAEHVSIRKVKVDDEEWFAIKDLDSKNGTTIHAIGEKGSENQE